MNYDELNKIIKEFLNNSDSKSYLETMENIKILAETFILNYEGVYNPINFVTNIPLSNSINLSNDFFKSIDGKYSEKFLKLLDSYGNYEDCSGTTKTVEFTEIDPCLMFKFNRSGVTSDGKVYIDYCNRVFDIFNMCHEIVHRFSYEGYDSIIKKYLGETTTILCELYLSDYLKSNTDIDKNDINEYVRHRFNTVLSDSISVYVQITLIELYIKYGELNESILSEHLNSLASSEIYDKIYDQCGKKVKNVIDNGKIDFFIAQRYLIGLVLALKIKKENSYDTFNNLVEILGKSEEKLEDDIMFLQSSIPIFHDRDFSFDKNIVIENINNEKEKLNADKTYR